METRARRLFLRKRIDEISWDVNMEGRASGTNHYNINTRICVSSSLFALYEPPLHASSI